MKNTTEYQDLIRSLAEGRALSGADRIRLERLLAEDPDFARMYEQMGRLDGLVRDDRAQLLREARTDQLRAAVSTLSRSVPAGTAAAGTFSVGKIVSGGLLVFLLTVGVWFLLDRGEEGEVIAPVSAETSQSMQDPDEPGGDNNAGSAENIIEPGMHQVPDEDAGKRREPVMRGIDKESTPQLTVDPVTNTPEDQDRGNVAEGSQKEGEKQSKRDLSRRENNEIEGGGTFVLDQDKNK